MFTTCARPRRPRGNDGQFHSRYIAIPIALWAIPSSRWRFPPDSIVRRVLRDATAPELRRRGHRRLTGIRPHARFHRRKP